MPGENDPEQQELDQEEAQKALGMKPPKGGWPLLPDDDGARGDSSPKTQSMSSAKHNSKESSHKNMNYFHEDDGK